MTTALGTTLLNQPIVREGRFRYEGGFIAADVHPDPLDEQYPHTCFNCKEKLYFNHILQYNVGITKKHAKLLWKSKVVQFYCCKCYRDKAEKEVVEL